MTSPVRKILIRYWCREYFTQSRLTHTRHWYRRYYQKILRRKFRQEDDQEQGQLPERLKGLAC